MKNNLRLTSLLALFLFILFTGCQKDDLNLNETSTSQPQKTNMISADELLLLIQNPDIKNSVIKNTIKTKSLDGYLGNPDNYFEKLDFQDFDNYTLFLNDYSAETPYYKFFVVTIDNNNVENAFYVQYTPTEPGYNGLQPFQIKKFIGTMDIYDLQLNKRASIMMNMGTGMAVVVSEECTTNISVSEIPCSHGGLHNIGQSCEGDLINDAYVLVSVTVVCQNVYTYVYAGGGSGGGGYIPSAVTTFLGKLNPEDTAFLNANPEVKSSVAIYLNRTTDPNPDDFANELIKIAKELYNSYGVIGVDELNAIRMTREAKLKGYFTNPYDAEYFKMVDVYVETDLTDQAAIDPTYVYFTIQCAILKQQHPDWSIFRVYCEASLELIHVGLDVLGLVPAVGEVADLANGAIYSIQGDGTNAAFSFASAIPFAGWFSTGTKYAFKTIDIIGTNSKTTLKWLVKTDNVIKFGDRGQLRRVLNLTDASKQAHHIIPWGKSNNVVVQRAAKSDNFFHMNEALNGIAVANWRNQPNHNIYDNNINVKLNNFINANPNATPDQCYTQLMLVINQAKTAIINNPNVHLNDLNF